MSEKELNPMEVMSRLKDLGPEELEETTTHVVTSIASKDPMVGVAFVLFLKIINYVTKEINQNAQKRQEDLKSELRDCIDEVARDYAEFETSELKRRVDQVFEQHNEKFDRYAEILESIQSRLGGEMDPSDPT